MLGGGFGVAWTSGIFSGVMAPALALNLFSVQKHGNTMYKNPTAYLTACLPLSLCCAEDVEQKSVKSQQQNFIIATPSLITVN